MSKTAHRRETGLLRATRALARVQRVVASVGVQDVSLRIELAYAERDVAHEALQDLHGHKRGTPETYAKLDEVPVPQRRFAQDRMYETGQITIEQQSAWNEIITIYEAIASNVDVRSAAIKARVDGEGTHDELIEGLARIRLERVYSEWRERLPVPRQMVLDMILSPRSLVATGRVFNVPWRKARARLIHALDDWSQLKEKTWRMIDEKDVTDIYARIGCGRLRAR